MLLWVPERANRIRVMDKISKPLFPQVCISARQRTRGGRSPTPAQHIIGAPKCSRGGMQQVLCTGTGCCIRACIQRARAPRFCVRVGARPVPAGNPCITPWRPETFVGYGHLAAGTCHASHVPRNRRCTWNGANGKLGSRHVLHGTRATHVPCRPLGRKLPFGGGGTRWAPPITRHDGDDHA